MIVITFANAYFCSRYECVFMYQLNRNLLGGWVFVKNGDLLNSNIQYNPATALEVSVELLVW